MARSDGAQQEEIISVFLCTSKRFEWGSIREILGTWGDVEIVGQAPETEDPVVELPTPLPDVILVASHRVGQPIVSLVARLHAAHPQGAILVLGDPVGKAMLTLLRCMGSSGYLVWTELSRKCICGAVYGAVSRIYTAPLDVIDEVMIPAGAISFKDAATARLTDEEWMILRVLARDVTEADAARLLDIALPKLQRRLLSAKQKLGVKGLLCTGRATLIAGMTPADDAEIAAWQEAHRRKGRSKA